MNQPITLPAPLQDKLSALAAHIRKQRILRGLCLTALLALMGWFLVFALDSLVHFSQPILSVLLIIGVNGVAISILGTLTWALVGKIDFAALAALIEKQHPELKERLTSTINLTDESKQAHGSEIFIAHVLQETEMHTRTMVFRKAVAKQSIYLWGAGLAFLSLAIVALAVFQTERTTQFGQRLFFAWLPQPPLVIEVTPGNSTQLADQPLTISAKISTASVRTDMPKTSELVVTQNGKTRHIPMETADGKTFAIKLDKLDGTLTYHVKAGQSVSETFTLNALHAAELDRDKCQVFVTLPEYFRHVEQREQPFTLADKPIMLEYCRVRLHLPFRKPAKSAKVVIYDSENAELPPVWTGPVRIADNIGQVKLPWLPGTKEYRMELQTIAKGNVRETVSLSDFSVYPDTPPMFVEEGPDATRIVGLTEKKFGGEAVTSTQRVHPEGHLKYNMRILDLEGLGEVSWEYRVNDGPVQSLPLHKAKGDPDLVGEGYLPLSRLAIKNGDSLDIRLKVTDNFSIAEKSYKTLKGEDFPSKNLKPHSAYYPAAGEGSDGWLSLRIDEAVEQSPQQREIVDQRQEIEQELFELTRKLEMRNEVLKDLINESKKSPHFSPPNKERLEDLRKDTQKVQQELNKLAQKASMVPEMEQMAMNMDDVARKELARLNQSLQSALINKDNAVQRQKNLTKGQRELTQALERLKKLNEANDEVAQERLDAAKIEELAQKENDLSKETQAMKDKTDQDPKSKNDPQMMAKLEKMKAKQAELSEQVKKMTGDNLQQAMQQAQSDKAKALSEEARKLAQAQENMVKKADREYQQKIKELLADFAKKQQAIATKADKLGQDTAKDVRANDIPELNAQPTKKAADFLVAGAAVPALSQQEQALREMKRVEKDLKEFANRLDLYRNLDIHPRVALKQLVKLQQQLVKDMPTSDEHVRMIPLQMKKLVDLLGRITRKQAQVKQLLDKLVLPRQTRMLQDVRRSANQAVDLLSKIRLVQAYDVMQETRDSLEFMMRTLPDLPEKMNPFPKKSESDKAKLLALKQAKDFQQLGKEQQELHDALKKFLERPEVAGLSGKNHPLAKMSKEQQDLKDKTNALMKDLLKLSQNQEKSPDAKKSGEDAAKLSQDAELAMKQSQEKTKVGSVPEARQEAKNAAEKLKQAADQAKQMAMQIAQAKSNDKNEGKMQLKGDAAKALKEGQTKMQQAKQEMKQGKLGKASQSMKQAAQAMMKAAKQMKSQQQSKFKPMGKKPNQNFAPPQQAPLTKLPKGLKMGEGKLFQLQPGQLQSGPLGIGRADYGEAYMDILRQYHKGLKTMRAK